MNNKVLYYSSVCPDTEAFVEELQRLDIQYDEVNITESMPNLKRFLKIRDTEEVFDQKKELNQVGVPVLIVNNKEEIDYIFDLEKLSTL